MTQAAIPFTQYVRPFGGRRATTILRPAHIASAADRVIAAGYRFECEELTTGEVSLTIANDNGDFDIEVCANGPGVPNAVDRLVIRGAGRIAA